MAASPPPPPSASWDAELELLENKYRHGISTRGSLIYRDRHIGSLYGVEESMQFKQLEHHIFPTQSSLYVNTVQTHFLLRPFLSFFLLTIASKSPS